MLKKRIVVEVKQEVAEKLEELKDISGLTTVRLFEKLVLDYNLEATSNPTADSGRLDQMESKLKEMSRKISEVDCYTEKLGEDLMSLGGLGNRVDVLERKSYIFLNIDEDTTLEDIKQQFKEIEGDS